MEILQNFVAFSEYMNFTMDNLPLCFFTHRSEIENYNCFEFYEFRNSNVGGKYCNAVLSNPFFKNVSQSKEKAKAMPLSFSHFKKPYLTFLKRLSHFLKKDISFFKKGYLNHRKKAFLHNKKRFSREKKVIKTKEKKCFSTHHRFLLIIL